MKGIVFTEFLEMVETRYSPAVADHVIERAKPASRGAYTAIGNYDHKEMLALLADLSDETGVPKPELLQAFGRHLFATFLRIYPVFFEGATGAFDFLATVHDHIHADVLKLYPAAELPTLSCELPAPDQLVILYRSSRGLADLREGLIQACIAHFGENIVLSREPLDGDGNTKVRFALRQRS